MEIPFKAGNILLPKNIDMYSWSVVACDQYTSEPQYWKEVNDIVGDKPSTLRLTLPEIYLEDKDVESRIAKINNEMEFYINNDYFNEYKNSVFYIERTQSDGLVREGLIGIIDLEAYDYNKGSKSLVRATEKTVIERIPPRVKVRENALLELPHIMILIDDEKKSIIEDLKNLVTERDMVYDFDLMQNGGHVKGYNLPGNVIDNITSELESLCQKDYYQKKYDVISDDVLLFAMGDGNHSLATAKTCYENLKNKLGAKALEHPARYALVELVNLHSDALKFEAIHRVIFNTNPAKLLNELYMYYDVTDTECAGQKIEVVTKDFDKNIWIKNPKSNLAVGSLQMFLDEYLKNNEGKIDYIHGDDTTRKFGKEDNNIAFILPVMAKEELFKTVILDGALPRKTFSMGHSNDKRYYLEARKINEN